MNKLWFLGLSTMVFTSLTSLEEDVPVKKEVSQPESVDDQIEEEDVLIMDEDEEDEDENIYTEND